MRRFERRRSASLKGMVFLCLLFAFVNLTSAQTVQSTASASSTGSTPVSSQLQTFQVEQQALAGEVRNLIAQGATSDQIQAWRQQNASLVAAQQQAAVELGAEAAVEPKEMPPVPVIPVSASPTLVAFLTTQRALVQAQVQIHNQLLNALPDEVSLAQIGQMQQSEGQQLQQQHASDLQAQQRRAQTLTDEAAQQPLPVPPPLVMPPGASANLSALLTLRDQLMRARVALWNQNLGATAEAQDAALEQWQEQNAARFQQMQQLAQAVAVEEAPPATISAGSVTGTSITTPVSSDSSANN